MASVFCAVASEPASGSVSAKQPVTAPLASRGRYFAFCSSVPSTTSDSEAMPVLPPKRARMVVAACDTSMLTRDNSSLVSPAPPYSRGMLCPNRPSSRMRCTSGSGISSVWSICCSSGMHSLRMNWRTSASRVAKDWGSRIMR